MKTESIPQRIFTRFMRAFFYLLYQPMAWSYDLVAAVVSWGRWYDWVMTVLPYVKGPRILEIGHGSGHLQVELYRKGFIPFGIEASRQMGGQARRRISKQGYVSRLARGYAQNMPFPKDLFDQIVVTFPANYIYAQETLQEAYRTLKPGGALVVLPAAWITGKQLIDRGAAALFRVTGQSPDWDRPWSVPFIEAGFQTRVDKITRQSWSLVIISAHKPSHQPDTFS